MNTCRCLLSNAAVSTRLQRTSLLLAQRQAARVQLSFDARKNDANKDENHDQRQSSNNSKARSATTTAAAITLAGLIGENLKFVRFLLLLLKKGGNNEC